MISIKNIILLLRLKYQISILMIFKVFFQYYINTGLYTHTIEKNPSISSKYYSDTLA